MTAVVRTVLGDTDPAQLGVLDYHEHLFQSSPLLQGDELNDERASGDEAASLYESGVASMIEATPTGLERNVEAVARISARTGLAIVHTTGAHHAGHYAEDDPLHSLSATQLAALFTNDIRAGMTNDDGTPALTPQGKPIRAGIAKAGIKYWSIGSFESRVIEAVAATSAATGCAIMVHLDFGSATHEVLDRIAELGVDPSRVVLAHIDRNLDAGLHSSLAERGAYLGYDGMARHREAPDSAILDCLVAAVDAGAAPRIMLGGDVARSSRYLAYGGMPGLRYLPDRFLPRLAERVTPAAYELMTVTNGARLLALPLS
ncbi:aryldialkylphosphatase [Cryobacterium sp. PH31-O1]|uniref:phosphotriesterase family protein n=1 Tax=Cryobacterium sp. PH31-O1 TaxID=3046306 RepID=UPI0024B88839|nr:aryldialkylphosphatase [Cryobacterium sp. PH31-O1]MDJ0336692.1 aryldialkylphosphatase [Cryobacterium sp. PH31-O1]